MVRAAGGSQLAHCIHLEGKDRMSVSYCFGRKPRCSRRQRCLSIRELIEGFR